MKSFIKFLCIIILTNSCKINECDDIACFTPPEAFYVEFIDKSSNENLIANGTFSINDLQVIDLSTNSNVDFNFISGNNSNGIEIYTIGWKTEKAIYSFELASNPIFELNVDAERISKDCCTYTSYKAIKIENSEFRKLNNTYQILVDSN